MPALLALRLATYLMVCTGVAALYLANLIGAAGAALVVLAILVSWGHERARERGAVRPALGWSLVGAAAAAIAVDLFYLAYSLLDGMVHLLLFLILLRLFARRGIRDLRDAGLLSFFMLVAAASISFSLSFLVLPGRAGDRHAPLAAALTGGEPARLAGPAAGGPRPRARRRA